MTLNAQAYLNTCLRQEYSYTEMAISVFVLPYLYSMKKNSHVLECFLALSSSTIVVCIRTFWAFYSYAVCHYLF